MLFDGGSATWQAHLRICGLVPKHLKQRPDPAAANPSQDPAAREAEARLNTIYVMIEYASLDEVAQVSGTPRQTITRWMEDPSFRRALFEARCAAYGRSLAALQWAGPEASQFLIDLQNDPKIHIDGRIRAAKSVLRQAKLALDQAALECRLDTLEEGIKQHIDPPAPPSPTDADNPTPSTPTGGSGDPPTPGSKSVANCRIPSRPAPGSQPPAPSSAPTNPGSAPREGALSSSHSPRRPANPLS